MRLVRHTLTTRFFAVLLVCLAASPLTAPFSTCDLSDFTHHDPTEAPRPGPHSAFLDVKIVHDLDTAPLITPTLPAITFDDRGAVRSLITTRLPRRAPLQTVLRL